MTLIAGKRSIQERIYNLQRQSRSYNTAAHCKDIGIVMQSCRFRAEAVCTECCTHTFYFIRCDGDTDTGSADQDSFSNSPFATASATFFP